MGCAIDFFQRTEDNQLFRMGLMGQWKLFDCMLHGPLLNFTVTLSHCPLIGLTGWAEGCD